MIYIVPDTNKLHISYKRMEAGAYKNFFFNSFFEEILEITKSLHTRGNIQVLIPEVVVEELMIQKQEDYEEELQQLNQYMLKFGVFTDNYPESPEQYMETLSAQVEDYFYEHKDIKRMPMCGSEYFKFIVDDALHKRLPFEGKEKKSDKGFKDALIYYSIKDYAKTHEGEYYLLTDDDNFHSLYAREQKHIEWENGSTLKIIHSTTDLMADVMVAPPKRRIESVVVRTESREYVLPRDGVCCAARFCESIPIIDGDETILKVINEKNVHRFTDFRNWWNNYDRRYMMDDPSFVFMAEMKGTVTYNRDGILSIRYIGWDYTGGLHDESFIAADVYDINAGRKISLVELMKKDEEEILFLIETAIQNDKKVSGSGKYYYDDLLNIPQSTKDVVFYLAQDGVHVAFNECELGPFASGIIDLIIDM